MKTLELFAGSRSFSKEADKLGIKTFTTDNQNFEKIDLVCDIFDFDINKLPYKPDIIWASPPCTTFSVASIRYHWDKDRKPKSEKSILGMKILEKTIKIIKELDPKYYYIENPRGMMRKQKIMDELKYRHTIWYCQYGDETAKPTDIWTNNPNWNPRPVCKNGNPNCHHQRAPRGAKTGVQGKRDNYSRSIIPPELCKEIIKSSWK